MRRSTKHIRDCVTRNQVEEQRAPIDASRPIQNEGDLDPAMVKRYLLLKGKYSRPISGMQSEDEIEVEIRALETEAVDRECERQAAEREAYRESLREIRKRSER